MKYCFITALHYLDLESQDMSVRLKDGIISNKRRNLDSLFGNSLSRGTLGLHSIDALRESTYYMTRGESNHADTEFDPAWNNFAFALLRQSQFFVDSLWYIKDNSVYVIDGFLYVYEKQLEGGCTFKASVTRISSFSNTYIHPIVFSEKELLAASSNMLLVVAGGRLVVNCDYKEAMHNLHYEEMDIDRKQVSELYIKMARWGASAPMKLMMYSTAMEALVMTGDHSSSNTVSSRIAFLLGKTEEERKSYFEDIKHCYKIRSKVAHGDFVKGKIEEITALSVRIDAYLRGLMRLDYPYSLSDKELDAYFSK